MNTVIDSGYFQKNGDGSEEPVTFLTKAQIISLKRDVKTVIERIEGLEIVSREISDRRDNFGLDLAASLIETLDGEASNLVDSLPEGEMRSRGMNAYCPGRYDSW